MRLCVVVLGDIGRNPRMQYHSIAIADNNNSVDIIGYAGSDVLKAVESNQSIRIHHLPHVRSIPFIRFRLFNYIWKTIWQFFTLLFIMVKQGDCFDGILVQNPPAIPALIVCWLYCFTYSKKFIIDWHNYAYSLMGEKCSVNLTPKKKIVRFAKFIEFYFGRKADLNFCVSKAMKQHLKKQYNIEAIVLYDKPNEIFQPISLKDKHDFLENLKTYPEFNCLQKYSFTSIEEDGTIIESPNRPGLIVSSTSWTEDEDFKLLLNALKMYEKAASDNSHLPPLICIISGKGPLKTYYSTLIHNQNCWDKVTFILPWLNSEDYPLLIASSNLGICLHTSSTGLDLPMKVLDMFGCSLPVLAYDYKCLSNELVENDKNGFTFYDANGLSNQLIFWFTDFPINNLVNKMEKAFKEFLIEKYEVRWNEYWKKTVGKYFISKK